MHYDLNDVYKLLQTLHANQIGMIGMLNQLLNKEQQIMVDLTAATAEIANNTTVDGSIITLLNQLANQVANIPPSNDPQTQAALDALVAQLTQNDQAIAAAVVKNTPAAPAG